MTKIILFIFTCIFTVSLNAEENKFQGTWQLISGEYINHEGKLIQYSDLQLSSIKVISATHFSFVSMAGDTFWSSGAGHYRFSESEYIETPIHTSYPVASGTEYVFKYKIAGDLWYNTRWSNGSRVEFEVWQRLTLED